MSFSHFTVYCAQGWRV